MSDLKNEIERAFYRDDVDPIICEDVGDLIMQLKKLPKDLSIKQGLCDGVRLIVYNVDTNPVLSFDELQD
jgi:hypothetical protein